MLARCTRSLVSRLLPGRFALVTPCEVAPVDGVATDISGLLLLQDCLRGKEVGEREGRKDQSIEPEIGKPESFGEGTDADWLEPGRWKHQADKPSLAGEGGHRHQQTGKVYRRYDGENGGRKDCGYLGLGEGRDELPETASRENIEQRAEREGCERSLDRHVENEKRHQHQKGKSQHSNGDIRELLARQELEFADGRGAEIGDRTGFLLEHSAMVATIAGIKINIITITVGTMAKTLL